MKEEIKKHNPGEEDEIDLIALAKTTWNKRAFIIKTILAFAIVGVVVALLSPKEYTASTKMVPQVSTGGSRMGGLSSLASMAGINLNLNSEVTELMPQTYPQVLKSAPFQLQLMNAKYTFTEIDQPVSLFEYYTEYSNPNALAVIKKYTIGLPGVIVGALRGEKTEKQESTNTNNETINLTEDQEQVRKILSSNVSLEINDQEGFIQLSSSFPEPKLAAQVAQKAKELLQQYITEFKIEKAKAQLQFIEERYNEKKEEFEQAQEALAAFRDRNKNVTSAMALTDQEQLQNEYQLAFEVYSSLAQQLEQARIKVKEDTPVFAVIQPVVVPSERSKPKRTMILAIWIFLGIIVAIGWVFGSQYISSAKKHWNEIE